MTTCLNKEGLLSAQQDFVAKETETVAEELDKVCQLEYKSVDSGRSWKRSRRRSNFFRTSLASVLITELDGTGLLPKA